MNINDAIYADRVHGEQLGLHDEITRIDCSWCGGTGVVRHWEGWMEIGDRPCARCGGRGSILLERGCHD